MENSIIVIKRKRECVNTATGDTCKRQRVVYSAVLRDRSPLKNKRVNKQSSDENSDDELSDNDNDSDYFEPVKPIKRIVPNMPAAPVKPSARLPPLIIPSEDESLYELEIIDKQVNTIADLIDLGKMYDPNKKRRYNFNLKVLNRLIVPLEKLQNIIGLQSVKECIVGIIKYKLQNLQNEDMMHSVIRGPPGVGKTMLGQIIGEIYYSMGIIKGNFGKSGLPPFTFKTVRRSDLIGQWLGSTAIKTQAIIDSCQGGVLFLDEIYALGNSEQKDSFSKECIDTINQNLSENKANFICIIAGYEDAIDKCFFSYNEGLRRRFSSVYTITPYTAIELYHIFIKMVHGIKWTITYDPNTLQQLFRDNYKLFNNYAGDCETLLYWCKIENSKRMFGLLEMTRQLTKADVDRGFAVYVSQRAVKKEDESWRDMFI
ncbi:MAG: AAA family ATPase [Faunusvirus sp.]|jgi:SpoVK/Ycf46/Vps4 family AAA+-type ATPase|uniref:AAA family ATPase n=1 Tax=Faunusvirus sp. TaxID=2487766 RepID=A0A3G4ZXT5_9VIRU|nr:MAG: AAA family ATPase [Faunusvirus sp.]